MSLQAHKTKFERLSTAEFILDSAIGKMLKSKIQKYSNYLGTFLFVVMLAMSALIIAPMLRIKGAPNTYIVVSGSMEPKIKLGSLIFTKTVDTKTLKENDIIVYNSPKDANDVIIHRIVEVKSTEPLIFKTKGDNNPSEDFWDVSDTQVKGKLVGSIPYLGFAGEFVREPIGFALLIILPALYFVLSQILSIRKEVNKEVEKKVEKELSKTAPITKLFFFLLCLLFIASPPALAIFSDKVDINDIKISTKSSFDEDNERICKEFNKKETDIRKKKHEDTEQHLKGKDHKFRKDWFKNKYGNKNFQYEMDEYGEYAKCKKHKENDNNKYKDKDKDKDKDKNKDEHNNKDTDKNESDKEHKNEQNKENIDITNYSVLYTVTESSNSIIIDTQ